MTQDSPQTTLWKLIKDIRFGMLTHRSATGQLHAHPLTTQNKDIDEHSELYFFIPHDGELAQRLKAEAQTNVTYANPEKDSYVSLPGTAGFIEDKARKEALWSPAAKAWFPQGIDDPNLALLVIRIQHAEYWDVKESKMTQLFKMAKAAVTGNPPNMGEHRELSLS